MVLLAGKMFGFIDFGSTEIDRSQPPLLVQLSDLSEYRAASSNYELVIDLENDVKFLPDFVAGERSVMVAAGTVDAKVDFSGLTEQNIVVSDDRKMVACTCPLPVLADPRVDNERTQVVAVRGASSPHRRHFQRPTRQRSEAVRTAEEKLRAAAAGVAAARPRRKEHPSDARDACFVRWASNRSRSSSIRPSLLAERPAWQFAPSSRYARVGS